MSELPPAVDRIERAVARIEAAASDRTDAARRLAERHAALRSRVQDAVAALDAVVDQMDAS